MLTHRFDLTDGTIASFSQSLLDLRESIPTWLPLEVCASPARYSPFKALPRHQSVLRLARLFDGGKLVREFRWQPTFRSFLPKLSTQYPLLTELAPPGVDHLQATACLQIMAKELRFNICTWPSSFLRNKDMPNLRALEGGNVMSHVGYACHHWADRVSELETLDSTLLDMLSTFFQNHFLYWLEVMSTLGLPAAEALKKIDTVRVCSSSILRNMISLLIG